MLPLIGRLARLGLWTFVAAGALGCGCDGGAGDGGSEDAGFDAGSDAGFDAGEDSGMDAAVDSGWDSGRDAGPDGGAEWVGLPGLPDGCVVERALRPGVLFAPEWTACGDSCLRLVHEGEVLRTFSSRAGAYDGARGYFVVVQSGVVAPGRIVILARTDGPALAAWRGPPASEPGVCQVGPVGLNATHIAFGIRVTVDRTREFHVFHASIPEARTVEEPIVVVDESLIGRSGANYFDLSSTTVAAQIQPGGFVLLLEDGAVRRLAGPTSEVPGSPHNVHVVGRAAYWVEWGRPHRLGYGSMELGTRLLHEAPPADVFAFGADGTAMAWTEVHDWMPPDGTYSRVELWTAPPATDPGDLAPRLVRELDIRTEARVGDGVYALIRQDGGHRLELYDLADGRRRTFEAPPATGFSFDPLYVSDEEVLLLVIADGGRTLFRIDPSALPYDGG